LGLAEENVEEIAVDDDNADAEHIAAATIAEVDIVVSWNFKHTPFTLAFVNDLDIVAVRIEHPCRIIARIVFEPSLRCVLALASGVHSRFVECIYLSMVFRYKSNMHRLGIGLSFFEPEKSSFAVTKTLQIGVSVLAFVICKVCDPKWLQGLGVKSD
jgi:hypothetical protein